jgi:hypothetical protein
MEANTPMTSNDIFVLETLAGGEAVTPWKPEL